MEKLGDGNYLVKLASNALIVTINTPVTKEKMAEYFSEYVEGIDELLDGFGDIVNLGSAEYIELEEEVLFIFKNKDRCFIALRAKEGVFFIDMDKKNRLVAYYEKNKERSYDIKIIKNFIDYLALLKRKYAHLILYDNLNLYSDANLIDEERSRVIIDDEVIELRLPKFRLVDSAWMKLTIVLKDTKEDMGYIEFSLSDNNFSYSGNVEYFIKEKFRNKGYATHALGLVKQIVDNYNGEVDKCLYVATVKDNTCSQQVIINNGGKIYYEGEVPKNDKTRIYNKVDYVKIYTIDVESLQE